MCTQTIPQFLFSSQCILSSKLNYQQLTPYLNLIILCRIFTFMLFLGMQTHSHPYNFFWKLRSYCKHISTVARFKWNWYGAEYSFIFCLHTLTDIAGVQEKRSEYWSSRNFLTFQQREHRIFDKNINK